MDLPTPYGSWSLGHTTNISPVEDRNGTRKVIFSPWSRLASLLGTSSGFAIGKDRVTEQNSGEGTSKGWLHNCGFKTSHSLEGRAAKGGF